MQEWLNKVHCGDNCDLLGQLPRDCIDLVVTSPPYDALRTYGGCSWDFYGVAWQLKRVLKPGGIIVWVVADQTKDGSESGTSMEQALHIKKLGLNLHDTMIYAKENAIPRNHKRYEQIFEYMFVFSKGSPKTVNLLQEKCVGFGSLNTGTMRQQGDDNLRPKHGARKPIRENKTRGNIWFFATGYGHSTQYQEAYRHPAILPEALAKDCVISWSNRGDIVLDPFMGSGTTAVVAAQLGRQWIGFEINSEYVTLARERIARGTAQLCLFNPVSSMS
jgi:site-specific DNA-methyltransferase (adenine-specific)